MLQLAAGLISSLCRQSCSLLFGGYCCSSRPCSLPEPSDVQAGCMPPAHRSAAESGPEVSAGIVPDLQGRTAGGVPGPKGAAASGAGEPSCASTTMADHPALTATCAQAKLAGALDANSLTQPELCKEIDALAGVHARMRHGQPVLHETQPDLRELQVGLTAALAVWPAARHADTAECRAASLSAALHMQLPSQAVVQAAALSAGARHTARVRGLLPVSLWTVCDSRLDQR